MNAFVRDPLGALSKAGNQIVLGNYTDDVSFLGTAGQIALGLLGLDVVTDVRDVFYDLTHWEWTWEHAGQTALDIAGLIPVVGAVKNVDEIGTLAKAAGKVDDAVGGAKGVEVTGAGIVGSGIVKRADKAGGGSKELIISKEGGFYRNVAGVKTGRATDFYVTPGGHATTTLREAEKAGKIHMHHLLPQSREFRHFFDRAKLDIEDYKIPLEKADHIMKPNGVHTGPDNWNAQWRSFFNENEEAGKTAILEQLSKMKKTFGLE